jgi:hypothetical protein
VAKEATQAISMRPKDILPYVSRQMIMAEELRNSFKGFTRCCNQGFAQVVHNSQRSAPIPAYVHEDALDLIVVL